MTIFTKRSSKLDGIPEFLASFVINSTNVTGIEKGKKGDLLLGTKTTTIW